MTKIFGKTLFEKKATPQLYDFAQHGILAMSQDYGINAYTRLVEMESATNNLGTSKPKRPKKLVVAPKPTPKELFTLKTLNTPELVINCDPSYLSQEIETLKLKQGVIGKPRIRKSQKSYDEPEIMFEGGQVGYGRQEVASMIDRLQNRKKYADFEKFYEEYPYTTNEAIRKMLDDHKHLNAKEATGMLPDLPREAMLTIKKYTDQTLKLCGKKPVFYLVAERAEEQAVQRKRDPILLAQSPFGFVWQILGAWDKEVVLLEEL